MHGLGGGRRQALPRVQVIRGATIRAAEGLAPDGQDRHSGVAGFAIERDAGERFAVLEGLLPDGRELGGKVHGGPERFAVLEGFLPDGLEVGARGEVDVLERFAVLEGLLPDGHEAGGEVQRGDVRLSEGLIPNGAQLGVLFERDLVDVEAEGEGQLTDELDAGGDEEGVTAAAIIVLFEPINLPAAAVEDVGSALGDDQRLIPPDLRANVCGRP